MATTALLRGPASGEDGDATATRATEILLSKAISLCVISGSLIGKLPQVHAVWQAESADGLSVISIWMEVVSQGIQFSYNVVRETPLTTYAEVPIIFVQLLLLCVTVAWAEGYLGAVVCLSCLGIVGCTAAMALQLVPSAVTASLYAVSVLFGFIIVGPQVIMNFRNRSTGHLSFVVSAMSFFGLTSRLFTTLVEVDDFGLRMTTISNWLLMSVLMLQFWLYRRKVSMESPLSSPRLQPTRITWEAEPTASNLKRRGSQSLLEETSLAHCVSRIGSSRCMSDLLNDEGVVLREAKSRIGSVASMASLASFGSVPSLSGLV